MTACLLIHSRCFPTSSLGSLAHASSRQGHQLTRAKRAKFFKSFNYSCRRGEFDVNLHASKCLCTLWEHHWLFYPSVYSRYAGKACIMHTTYCCFLHSASTEPRILSHLFIAQVASLCNAHWLLDHANLCLYWLTIERAHRLYTGTTH